MITKDTALWGEYLDFIAECNKKLAAVNKKFHAEYTREKSANMAEYKAEVDAQTRDNKRYELEMRAFYKLKWWKRLRAPMPEPPVDRHAWYPRPAQMPPYALPQKPSMTGFMNWRYENGK